MSSGTEVRPDPGQPGRAAVYHDGALVATVVQRPGGVTAWLDVAAGRDGARAVVGALAGAPVVDTADLLLRYELRRAGYTGGLGGLLRTPAPDAPAGPVDPVGGWTDVLPAMVEGLVPGAEVTAQARRSLFRWASAGVGPMVELVVQLPGNLTIRVSCPDAPDLVPENVALVVQTVLAISRRFSVAALAIGHVLFDHRDASSKAINHAGSTHQNLRVVHLNAFLATADGLVQMGRKRASIEGRPPGAPGPTAMFLTGVMAHEAWHQIEGAVEARSYRTGTELRRRLGEQLGVESLEQAIRGGEAGVPESWRVAHRRLVTEVSAYAATTPREATAEMFKQWWGAPVEHQAATGGRFHPNYDRIGGLKDDLPRGWVAECREAMKRIRTYCDQLEDLLMGNEIFETRTRGVGVIPAQVGLSYGLSGANIRASGVDWDLRRDQPSPLVWKDLDWKVWTHPDGDSFARYWVRLQETREATKIVEQCLDGLPAGPIQAKVPRIIKVPAGEAWCCTENPLGEMGYYIVSQGGLGPFRVKIRSASFNNISIVPWLLKGVYVPDIITILSSLYFILGDIDR